MPLCHMHRFLKPPLQSRLELFHHHKDLLCKEHFFLVPNVLIIWLYNSQHFVVFGYYEMVDFLILALEPCGCQEKNWRTHNCSKC